MTDAVKIVPLVADEAMKAAAEKLWKDSDFNFVQFEPEDFYEEMVRTAPASDYVAVRRSDAEWIEDLIVTFKDQLVSGSTDEVHARILQALQVSK